MAVQAQQYTASILFPNRDEQDDKGTDLLLLPMQAQPSSAAFADQPSFLVNGGNHNTNNARKRVAGQMLIDGAAAAAQLDDPVAGGGGLFSLQLPQNLPTTTVPFSGEEQSLLCNPHYQRLQHQPSLVSTGLHLQLPLQQQQQQQHQHQHQQQPQGQQRIEQQQPQQLMLMPSSYSITDDLAATIRLQDDEIDQLIQAQTEHLRRSMAETTRRHLQALVATANESTARRLRETEAELEKARRRNAELEHRAAQAAAQTAVWKDKTRAYVLAAASLQAQIRQATAGPAVVEDPQGSVDSDDAESACIDPRREERNRNVCRRCRRRDAVVVVLPCRHLCVCRSCEPAVQACPVCFCARSASVEVYLS